jgi:hypothetical protein
LGDFFDGTVFALGSHDGRLVAGGAFQGPSGQTDPLYPFIASFTGDTWGPLGTGIDAAVHALLDVDGTLYAGGDLYANIAVTFGLARIAPMGDWEPLLPDHANYLFPNPGPAWVGSLAWDGEQLYFGGDFFFDEGPISTFSYNLLRFDGSPDAVTPMIGVLNGALNAMAVHNDHLVIGGDFDMPIAHAATLDLSTGLTPVPGTVQGLRITPTVVTDQLTAEWPAGIEGRVTVTLRDPKGALVPVASSGSRGLLRIATAGLAPGTYGLEVTVGGQRFFGRFVRP